MRASQNETRIAEKPGLVFNIQKFSLHDGFGIRTLVFLKGCPLQCEWCANPEGQSFLPELAYTEAKCIGVADCGFCKQACNRGAIAEGRDGKIAIDRTRCDSCGACVEVCPAQALARFGEYMSVDQVIHTVEEDSGFYSRSGGGVTIGGGEPLSQAGYVMRLLERARSRGVDTAIETCGWCDWKDMAMVCRHVDQIFYDIKCMDPEKHKRRTGVSNRLILENFRKLCGAFPQVRTVVRTPVIPGFNDTVEDIREIAVFLNTLPGVVQYELLPYHGFGEQKYHRIGKVYRLSHIKPLEKDHLNILKRVAERAAGR